VGEIPLEERGFAVLVLGLVLCLGSPGAGAGVGSDKAPSSRVGSLFAVSLANDLVEGGRICGGEDVHPK